MKYLFSLLGTAVLLSPAPLAIAQRTNRPDFFERGDRLLEQEVQRLQRQQQQTIVDPALTVEGQQSGWQWHQVVFQDGKFSVWMPQGVLSEETETIATPTGELKFKVIATNPEAARFIVAYSEELNPAQLEDSATLFALIRDEMIKDTDFKFQGDRAITLLENYPGREFTLQNGQETITMRIFAIDRQIYLLGSEQATSDSSSPAAIAFFNSFKRL